MYRIFGDILHLAASKGGRLCSRLRVDFHCPVIFTYVNIIEEMPDTLRVEVEVVTRANITFTHNLSYIASVLFAHTKIRQQWKSTLSFT